MSDLDTLKLYSGVNPKGVADAGSATIQGTGAASTSMKTMAAINPVGSPNGTVELLTGRDSSVRPVVFEQGLSPKGDGHLLSGELPLFTVTP